MRAFLLVSGLVVGPLLVGCTAATESVGASDDALTTSVLAGDFKLYEDADHHITPLCDVYTKLELSNAPGARAHLKEELGAASACLIFIAPREREYPLTFVKDDCGSKIYAGSRQVNGKPVKIKITDHRHRACRDLQPAQIIVEEDQEQQLGNAVAPPTTLYSYDKGDLIEGSFAAGDASSLSGKLFEAMKAHAQDGTQSPTISFVQAVGGSTVKYKKDGSRVSCTAAVIFNGPIYTCDFAVKPAFSEWTSSSDSVQAELHEAIRAATNGGNNVELSEGSSRISCNAGTLGAAQVMSYRCAVTF